MSDLPEAKKRITELLINNRHACMATVNEDGSPHNTPFFFVYRQDLRRIYWGSHPTAQHSQNLLRTGKAFIVLYDSDRPKQGGLYLETTNGHA